MKKFKKPSQRLLAMLLVAVLVVGLVPIGVQADQETTAESFKLKLTAVSEETNETVYNAEVESPADATATYFWCGGEETTTSSYTKSSAQEVTLWVNLSDGRSLYIELNGEQVSGEFEFEWGVSAKNQDVYAGVEFTPGLTLAEGSGSDNGADFTWVSALAPALAPESAPVWEYDSTNTAQSASGGYYPKAVSGTDVPLAKCVLTLLDGKTIVVPFNATVQAAPCTVEIYPIASDSDWYGEEQTVQVYLSDLSVADESYYPDVLVNDVVKDVTWTDATSPETGNAAKLATVPVSETSTVTCGGCTRTVQIDTEAPTVSIDYAYVSGENKVTVVMTATTGDSGVKQVTVNTGASAESATLRADGKYVLEIGWDLAANSFISAAVTANNGKSGASGPLYASAVTEMLVVEPLDLSEDEIVGTVTDDSGKTTVYLTKGEEHEVGFRITGLGGTPLDLDTVNSTYSYTKKDGTVVTDNVTEDTVTLTFTDDDVMNFSITVQDNAGRTATATANYSVDLEAPVVTVERSDEPVATAKGAAYYNVAGLTYTFKLTDALPAGAGKCSVKYQYAGDAPKTIGFDENGVASITVTAGQTLEYMEVVAKDATGNVTANVLYADGNGDWAGTTYGLKTVVDNTPPAVEIAASANITGFGTNNGKVFGLLNNATDTQTYTVTVTVSDANLNGSSFDGTWTANADGTSYAKTFTVENLAWHTTGKLTIDGFTAMDYASNGASSYVLGTGSEDSFTHTVTAADGGVFSAQDVLIDRRAPSSGASGAPSITWDGETSPATTRDDGLKIYNNTIIFAMAITDASEQGNDVGVKSVNWTVNDGLGGTGNTFLTTEGNVNGTPRADGKYTVEIKLNGINETDNAVLTVVTEDFAGNRYEKTVTFGADNRNATVTVTKTVAENSHYVQNIDSIDYYNGEVTYTFTPEDTSGIEEAKVTYTILENGEETTESLDLTDANNRSFTLVDGQTLTSLTVYVKDTTGHVSTAEDIATENADSRIAFDNVDGQVVYVGKAVEVDTTPPKADITVTPETPVRTVNGVDYYNGEVTYTVTIQEKNLQTAELTYTLEGETAVQEVAIAVDPEDSTKYTGTFTLADGQVLTGMTLNVGDKAGWDAICTGGNMSQNEGGAWSYNGNTVVVDETDPKVTVTKTGTLSNTYNGVDYYDNEVTYTIQVTDQFMEGLTPVAEVTYLDGDEPVAIEVALTGDTENAMLSESETYTGTLTLEDGDAITSITIQAVDNAGRAAQTVTAAGTLNMEYISYNEEEETVVYTRKEIVDMTAPVAEIAFSDNVESFYTNGNTAYVKLTEPATGSSGNKAAQEAQTITMGVKVTDKNLAVADDSDNTNCVKSNAAATNDEWNVEDISVNQDSEVYYFKYVTVAADNTGYIAMDMTILDLAGNPLESVDVQEYNETSMDPAVSFNGTTGSFNTTVVVDRRRPTSGESKDGVAPVIEITPSVAPVTTVDGKDLFSSAPTFALKVTDGTDGAGLATVNWTFEDGTGFVKKEEVKKDQAAGTHTQTFSVPVNLNTTAGESNQVKLTITAVDNVGNTTTYVKEFAVDTLAPRVTVSYDNNAVQNGKYFKADRTVTIAVTDINFNAAATKFTTEVAGSAWSQSGDTHTISFTYNTDGDYTFDMSAADKANNASVIDFTNGGKNAAPKEFTIDKTAPVLRVSYDPSVHSGKDSDGVLYYNKNLDMTVTITEHNFNSADVKAVFNSNNGLSGWYSSGDTHSAYETFTEGNGYQFSIAYTDLAGNPAVTYYSDTFSVDTHAPTIEITSGTMTNKSLNIVQGDLVLGFTVNDAQDNLKNFTATVTQLNNEFKEVKVSGSEYFTIRGENDRTTGYVDFTNIAKEKLNDGIYTVQITAEDYAGNTVQLTPELMFSLNRFGSTFMTDDEYTAAFLTPSEDGNVYHSDVQDKLVIKEINPNRVWQDSSKTEEGSAITISVNGSTVLLEKGVDYTVTVSQEGTGSNKWYVYTYEIDPTNFLADNAIVDGRYSILLYGEDEAGNKNTNESNVSGSLQMNADGEYTGKVEFTLDTKAPIITILGVEEGKIYNAAFRRVTIGIADNTPVGINVYVDDQLVKLETSAEGLADNQQWLVWDAEAGEYILNLVEQDSILGGQDIRVEATDAAGNGAEKEVRDVLLSTNWFVRFINNTWLLILTIVLLAAVIVVIILILKKKKDKKEEEAKQTEKQSV